MGLYEKGLLAPYCEVAGDRGLVDLTADETGDLVALILLNESPPDRLKKLTYAAFSSSGRRCYGRG
jgi:hypothetical protein